MSTAIPSSSAPATSEQPHASWPITSSAAVSSMAPVISEPPSSGVAISPGLSSRMQLPPPNSYNNFNMPEPFTWTSTIPSLPPPPVLTPSASPARASSSVLPAFSGPTWTANPLLSTSDPLPVFRTAATPVNSSPLAQLFSQLSFSTPNVTNIVTTRLATVEDYLSWRTQFESFLVSHGLIGILDGSLSAPPALIRGATNPDYTYWLRIDQTVRSWLFATLSRDILIEVRDLHFSAPIWERLETRFMAESIARAMELKRGLNNLKKKESQSMDEYLRDIKNLADSLNSINSPVTNRELLLATVQGLGPEYESLITSITLFPDNFTIDSLRPQLLALEQRALYLRSQNIHPGHQAFGAAEQAAAAVQRPAGRGGDQQFRGNGGGRGYRGNSGRQRGHRGRGRGYGGQNHQQYAGQPYQQLRGPPVPGYGAPGWQNPPPAFAPRAPHAPGFQVDNFQSPPPPIVCQICFSPGHSALACPRYVNPSAPALVALPTGESNESVWYPDSGASAHMTPSEGQPHGGHPSSSNQ
ncbi:unnamed protein product [Cuscuta epithymum]|uniref:Retrotransposon Copia-like N-terminal domain-containing protein n=2 Tax=Cuscuta epithymum TaxID=186058 RepID=A0AAV0FMI9_9ASTE|nr:unnamed protein product [Cuscuta epithymum]